MKNLLTYFLVGGVVTSAIVALEQGNHRILSGLATLIPVFTVVAYFFIGESRGGVAVSQHAWLVLVGTLVSWVPYMVTVAMLAPKIGAHKAILAGLGVFFMLALAYLGVVNRFGFFK